MAIPAQGCVIRWTDFVTGTSLIVQEVRDIDFRPAIGRIEFRDRVFFYRAGEISLSGFSNAVLNARKLLDWGTLKITVRSGAQNLVLHEGYAQLISTNSVLTVNEAVLFGFQLQLWGIFESTGSLQ